MEFFTASEKETFAAGEVFAKELCPGDVVALFGGLGAGKTAFVRGLVKGLGIETRVTSPTFTIVNEYLGKIPVFHFDMYRISDEDELFEIGWEDYLQRGGVCAVEWSENIESMLPCEHYRVTISHSGENSRKIEILHIHSGEKI